MYTNTAHSNTEIPKCLADYVSTLPCNKHMLQNAFLEVLTCSADYGYEVDYTRVPVTDEKAPKEKDFALLMRRLWRPSEGAALIFNCQMGRGRTSTGMIIASLLQLRRRLSSVDMPSEPQGAQH